MSFRIASVVFCATAAAVLGLAQPPADSLASLIEAGNHKAALAKIRAGADVNEAQPDGTRPIHWAVYHVDYEVLDALIAKKAKVDVTNEFGSTPLAEAVKLADARLVKTLLGAGASPESPNRDGETALMLATKTGDPAVVELLIKAGADVNAVEKFHNQTALMYAAAAPKNAGLMVRMLLAKDASVKPRSLYRDWPSQITSEPRAQYRPVGGLTALLYAARNGCYDCVEAFIGAGADLNLPTPEGVTPLMIALDNDHPDVAKLLLDHGANPRAWDWWGRTALYIAIDRKETLAIPTRGGSRGGAAPVAPTNGRPTVSAMDMVNALLAADIDPEPQLNMHRPSRGGNSGRFGDPLLSTGCTPLLRATMAGDMDVVRALLAKGASPNVVDMGLTPFLVAAGVGTGNRGGAGPAGAASAGGPANMELMNLLIQHGADINAQVTGTKTYSMRIARSPATNEGMTALHTAVQAGRVDMVRYLISKGAKTDLVDSNGHKPIDLAVASAPQAAGGRGGPPAVNAATVAEIRAMLEKASQAK